MRSHSGDEIGIGSRITDYPSRMYHTRAQRWFPNPPAQEREICMKSRRLGVLGVLGAAAIVVAAVGLLRLVRAPGEGQTAAPGSGATAPAPKTPWGDPDLQGIWT